MALELRTFAIRDGAAEDDEARVAAFLRSVEVVRIDTAFAADAWRILVHYEDPRRKEERAQIESAISDAVDSWRVVEARRCGIDRESVLSQAMVAEIARYAPTTETELSVIAGALGADTGPYGADIVQIVRRTMACLTGDAG